MDKVIAKMINSILKYNLYLGAILGIYIFINPKQAVLLILGLFVGTGNFILSTIVNSYFMKPEGALGAIRFITFARILVVVAIGAIIFVYNKLNVLLYAIGFTLHFIGIVMYGIRDSHKEGSE
ncbi:MULTISPECIES: hypothetical protein [Clostridium]|uniref:ATP synthase subunit I n=1 Tax=Clostridium cadaveris TaxID=1529 RepID=A0A1I2LFP9_9CLOT|nr:hypothetical protein [Clostridium cadaveris]MDU4951394.1 hypothetical protein [Clostridium sp.]MDM8310664.1 hypothetical protein [Clostridium cadaveris]MDY4950677.1 hypothetical protein [Clostridium cadaveris]NME65210.1 hypothetical protein [Clostridium cadaveris]NWK10906.1 hypothetical protein [Clostridium cadaveris]